MLKFDVTVPVQVSIPSQPASTTTQSTAQTILSLQASLYYLFACLSFNSSPSHGFIPSPSSSPEQVSFPSPSSSPSQAVCLSLSEFLIATDVPRHAASDSDAKFDTSTDVARYGYTCTGG